MMAVAHGSTQNSEKGLYEIYGLYISYQNGGWEIVSEDELDDSYDATIACPVCEKFIGTARNSRDGEPGDVVFFQGDPALLVEMERLFIDIEEKIERINAIWKELGGGNNGQV